MRLKKAVGILAVSMMVFSLLAGCAKKEEADSQSESTEAATEASEAAEEAKIEKPESYGTVKLGEYKGVEIVVADSTVSDELLEQDIEYVLSQDYEFETVTGRAAELGDTVNIDYEGTENGEAFAGGTAQGTDLELGSGRFVANS